MRQITVKNKRLSEAPRDTSDECPLNLIMKRYIKMKRIIPYLAGLRAFEKQNSMDGMV